MTRRSWQIWLVACAFLVKALLPVGYMLATPANGSGFPQIVICTAGGTKLVTFDKHGNPVEKDAGADEGSCPFAMPAMAILAIAPGLKAIPHTPRAWSDPFTAPAVVTIVGHTWQARAPPPGFTA